MQCQPETKFLCSRDSGIDSVPPTSTKVRPLLLQKGLSAPDVLTRLTGAWLGAAQSQLESHSQAGSPVKSIPQHSATKQKCCRVRLKKNPQTEHVLGTLSARQKGHLKIMQKRRIGFKI